SCSAACSRSCSCRGSPSSWGSAVWFPAAPASVVRVVGSAMALGLSSRRPAAPWGPRRNAHGLLTSGFRARHTAREEIAHLVEEPLALRRHVLLFQLGQFAEEFLLALGQLARRLDQDLHEQVALPAAADARHALARQPQDLAGLGAALQVVRRRAFE